MCAIASSFLASHGRLQAECNTLFIPAAFCVDGARLFRKALRSDNHLIGRALWHTHREFPSRVGIALPAEFLVTGPAFAARQVPALGALPRHTEREAQPCREQRSTAEVASHCS